MFKIILTTLYIFLDGSTETHQVGTKDMQNCIDLQIEFLQTLPDNVQVMAAGCAVETVPEERDG